MSSREKPQENQPASLQSDSEVLVPEKNCSSPFRPRRKQRLILWITLAFFLTIAIVLAIVLGTVLSRRPQQSRPNPGTSDIMVAMSPSNHITENVGNLTALSKYAALIPMEVIEGDMVFNMRSPNRVFVVGDVHGCANEFNALIDAIQYNYDAGDRIILVGDLVAKGPNSIGVLRRAQQLRAWCVRGNHDDKVVRLATYVRQVAPRYRKQHIPEGPVYDPLSLDDTHMGIVNNMTDDDYHFLDSCPMMLGIPSIGSLFVHAGVDPSVSLDHQEPYFVMNIRSMTVDGKPVRDASSGQYPWSDMWNKLQQHGGGNNSSIYHKIYYGHAASRGLDLKEYSFGVDTGCVYGGQLTALDIKTGNVTQVSCGTYSMKEQ